MIATHSRAEPGVVCFQVSVCVCVCGGGGGGGAHSTHSILVCVYVGGGGGGGGREVHSADSTCVCVCVGGGGGGGGGGGAHMRSNVASHNGLLIIDFFPPQKTLCASLSVKKWSAIVISMKRADLSHDLGSKVNL